MWLTVPVTLPPYLQPFVVPLPEAQPRREGSIDIYRPGNEDALLPAIVFFHGGPVPPDLRPTPRDWPVYVGYGSLAAASGVIGVTVDYGFHSTDDYPMAAQEIAAAVTQARTLPGVDPEQVAVWHFSGGGVLIADWLRDPPMWLRCIALSYPRLAPRSGLEVSDRFRPIDAISEGSDIPILLTRAGREDPEIAGTVEAFLAAARASQIDVEVIDVPQGQHGFDMLDHTDESRTAVMQGMDWVVTQLRRPAR